MKRAIKIVSIFTIVIALIVIAHFSTAIAQEGPYSMPWSAISAGGGTVSTNGYEFISTFGQPVAGRIDVGSYTFTSGFLGLLEPPSGELPNVFFLPLFTK